MTLIDIELTKLKHRVSLFTSNYSHFFSAVWSWFGKNRRPCTRKRFFVFNYRRHVGKYVISLLGISKNSTQSGSETMKLSLLPLLLWKHWILLSLLNIFNYGICCQNTMLIDNFSVLISLRKQMSCRLSTLIIRKLQIFCWVNRTHFTVWNLWSFINFF